MVMMTTAEESRITTMRVGLGMVGSLSVVLIVSVIMAKTA
jgi:hypothetical protein